MLITLCALIGLVFALAGFLFWWGSRLLGGRWTGWSVFKTTVFGFLLALPIVLFLITPVVFSYLIANASTRPQDRALKTTPALYGRSFQEVRFRSRDGLRLRGWLLDGREGYPAFILCHGLFRDRHELLERGSAINEAGYPVLLFDFRSHGISDPKKVTLGFHERLDVLGAYDFLKESRGQERFVFLGVSMGAVAAVHAAVDCEQDLLALVGDSPFLDLKSTVSRHTRLLLNLPAFPFADIFVWNLTREGNFKAEALDTAQAVRNLRHVPVLLIYGEEDKRMPRSTARSVFEAIPHQEKKIVFFESAGHGRAYHSDPDRYLKTVLNFAAISSVPSR